MAIFKQPSPFSALIGTTCQARHHGFCCLLADDPASGQGLRKQSMVYASGDEVAVQGETCDRIGIIASGLIKLVVMTEDGDHHLLQLLKPGQIVGDPCKAENAFSWQAATQAEVCWINRNSFSAILKEQPHIYDAVLAIMAGQLEDHRLWVAAMRGRNTLQRIAYWLVQQVPKNSDTTRPVINIDLARRDLASLLDMTVETLCRGLHHLADRGAVALLAPDQVMIANPVKLRVFAKCADRRINRTLQSTDHPARQPDCFLAGRAKPEPILHTTNPDAAARRTAH